MVRPGSVLPVSLHVLSSTVVAGMRTVVVSRALAGTPFSFSLTDESMPLISAVGSGPTFGMHKLKTTGTLSLAAPETSVCVCRDPTSNQGTINGLRFNPGVCAPFPKSELLTTHNAVCNISEYGGGLYCCHDKVNLLDADQPINNKTVSTGDFRHFLLLRSSHSCSRRFSDSFSVESAPPFRTSST